MGSVQAQYRAVAFRFDDAHHSAAAAFDTARAGHDGALAGVPDNREYSALLAAFRATGGVARADDLARLFECLHAGNYISLARLIATGSVFGFSWRETVWIPMFQFELRDLSLNPQSQSVLDELAGAFSGWSLASWFAQPNAWLNQRRPVDLLRLDLAAVLQAARADRYLVNA